MSMPALSCICTRICPWEQHEGGDAIVSHADILLVARLTCAAQTKGVAAQTAHSEWMLWHAAAASPDDLQEGKL